MKKTVFAILFFLFPGCLLAAKLDFLTPTFEEPHYRIHFPLEVKKENIVVREVQLNDEKWESVFVFSQGKLVDLSGPLSTGTYDFYLDYAWRSDIKYRVTLLCQHENSEETKPLEMKGTSPGRGGIPGGNEGFYRAFKAEECIGMERKEEVCFLILTAPRAELENDELLLFDGTSPLDYQVMGVMETSPPEKAAGIHPVTWIYNIAFPLDMPAFGKKVILVLKGEPAPPPALGFLIDGEGLGKTVKNKRVALEFHSRSGQVNAIEFIREGIRLHNSEAGVLHWNPGCFIPGIAWDHSFNWNPPPSFEEKIGRFLYTSSRRGSLQKIKDVIVEVRYALDAHSPFFISETLMKVEKDLGVIALQNDEMVLHKDLFDSLIYRDSKGGIISMPLREKAGYPDGLVHVAADDVPWAGLLNTEKKYGFFSLRIEYANTSLLSSGSWLHKPGTCFYAPSDGKYVCWVRPLLSTLSDYTTRNLLTYVPGGSTFYEKNAYVLLPLGEDFPQLLDALLQKLKNPVRIY